MEENEKEGGEGGEETVYCIFSAELFEWKKIKIGI